MNEGRRDCKGEGRTEGATREVYAFDVVNIT